MQVARDMAAEAARLVSCPVEQVLVASTGVIGVALPIDKVRARSAGGGARARRRPGLGRGARHHDDRSVSEGGGRDRSSSTDAQSPSAAWRKARG